jgi:probable HAF family extracellular repeat protein
VSKKSAPALVGCLVLGLLAVAPAAEAAPAVPAAAAAPSALAAKASHDRLVDLGVDECAQDINDLGVIVTDTHVLVGRRVRPLPGGLETATRINDLGQIAGTVGGVAALWNGRRLVTIGVAVPGDTYSYVTGLNDLGQVVGTSGAFGGPSHAFRWSRGVMTPLSLVGASTGASDINNLGQISGYAWEGTSTQRAVRWDRRGTMARLGSLGDGTGDSLATSINDRGESVGYHYLSSTGGDLRAVRWSRDGRAVDITPRGGLLGVPTDINLSGRIVGSIVPSGSQQQGFVLDRSGAVRYVPAPAGSTDVLTSVNELGWAVGCVFTDDSSRAVLWRG